MVIIPYGSSLIKSCRTFAATREEGLSKYVDEAFDGAYNESQIAGDLPHLRWGRIDYLNVTRITTKWGVWQCVLLRFLSTNFDLIFFLVLSAPLVVILTDRGQTLRFYKPAGLRLQVELIREFLLTKYWETTPPWDSSFAPGGSR
jgi:hypothetical protein